MSASDRGELDWYEALVYELRANPPVAPERLRHRVLQVAPAASAPKAHDLAGVRRHAVTLPKNRLVHAVASLQVGVKRSELSAKTNEASQIVGSFGGYAQSVRYQASRRGYGESILELRVPVQKAEAAMARLGSLGTLLSQQVSTQDLQAKVTHQTS